MSDSASGAAGVLLGGERNERFRQQRGGRVVGGRKKRAIQRAARRARRRQEKEMSDSVSGGAGVLAGERNLRFSKRRRLAFYNRQACLLLKWRAMSDPASEAAGETE
jgi:hypothetical protein